jgi:hypothetical protein
MLVTRVYPLGDPETVVVVIQTVYDEDQVLEQATNLVPVSDAFELKTFDVGDSCALLVGASYALVEVRRDDGTFADAERSDGQHDGGRVPPGLRSAA